LISKTFNEAIVEKTPIALNVPFHSVENIRTREFPPIKLLKRITICSSLSNIFGIETLLIKGSICDTIEVIGYKDSQNTCEFLGTISQPHLKNIKTLILRGISDSDDFNGVISRCTNVHTLCMFSSQPSNVFEQSSILERGKLPNIKRILFICDDTSSNWWMDYKRKTEMSYLLEDLFILAPNLQHLIICYTRYPEKDWKEINLQDSRLSRLESFRFIRITSTSKDHDDPLKHVEYFVKKKGSKLILKGEHLKRPVDVFEMLEKADVFGRGYESSPYKFLPTDFLNSKENREG